MARQPLRRRERARREALAIPRRVRERHPLVRAVVRHDVRTRRGTDAHRGDRVGALGIGLAEPDLQLPRGARGRVHLGGVMLFQYKGVELRPPGEAAGQLAGGAKEQVHAEREVGGMEQGALSLNHQRGHPRQVLEPARGPGDGGDAGADQALDVSRCRVGSGELDGDVGACEAIWGEAPTVGVLRAADDRVEAMAALLRQAGDSLTHLAVADNQDTHWDHWPLDTKGTKDTKPHARTHKILWVEGPGFVSFVPFVPSCPIISGASPWP